MSSESQANQQKRVSVFVPSYNHAPFIERCLKSIIKQTLTPSELLVIDDGSKDDSAKIIEQVLRDCPFPSELIVNKNKGLCATLNEGLAKTSGDYFAYLGSDDIWLSEFLSARYELLESRPDAILGYGHGYLIDEQNNIIDCSSDWWSSVFRDGDVRPMLYRGIVPISSTFFYRRSFLEKCGWNEDARLEDYELYLQLSDDGDFALDNRVLSCWRMHGYNTSDDVKLMLNERLEAQERIARQLNWGQEKLKQIQMMTSFVFVEVFCRKGYKSEAFSLLRKNYRGADSIKSIGRELVRLSIPTVVFQGKQKFTARNSTRRHGTVEV